MGISREERGAAMGISGEERGGGSDEGLVEVPYDDHGFAHRLGCVEEDEDLLVDGVGGEQQLALGGEVLLDVLVLQALEHHAHP
jgi:hypothetical protein